MIIIIIIITFIIMTIILIITIFAVVLSYSGQQSGLSGSLYRGEQIVKHSS